MAKINLDDESKDITPLLDTILKHVPPAPHNTEAQLRMQPFNLAYDNYLGRLGVCRIYEGTVKKGMNVIIKREAGREQKSWMEEHFLLSSHTLLI